VTEYLCRAEARLSDGRLVRALRPRQQPLARPDVPGRHREVRPQDGDVLDLEPAPEVNRDMTQVNMTSPHSSHVDGKVWTNNNGFAAVHRLISPPASSRRGAVPRGRRERPNHKHLRRHRRSKNNVYFTTSPTSTSAHRRQDRRLTLFTIPTPRSAPRRAQMDANDASGSPSIAATRSVLHTRASASPSGRAAALVEPYDVQLDKNGEA